MPVDDPPKDPAFTTFRVVPSSGSPEPSDPQPPGDASSDEVPPYPYEEITLADLVVTIRDHWRPALAVLLMVLVLASVVTAEQPVRYSAHATLLPTNEQKTTLAFLASHAMAEAVAERLLYNASATPQAQAALADRVAAATTVTAAPAAPGAGDVITVRVTWPTASGAAAVANAYATALPAARVYLRNATYSSLWPSYYAKYNDSAANASAHLSPLVANMTFAQPLDAASVPSHPASPSWRLNLALGATLGLMLAFLTPFTLEALASVRRELAER